MILAVAPDGWLYLEFEVMWAELLPSGHTERSYSYDMALAKLHPEEMVEQPTGSLSFKGELKCVRRFERYQSMNHIKHHSVETKMTLVDYDSDKIEEQINWISEQTIGNWGMEIEFDGDDSREGDSYSLYFTFFEIRDATLFKTFWI